MSGHRVQQNNRKIDALKRIDMFLCKHSQYTRVGALLSVHVLEESSSEEVVISIDINLFNIGEVTRKESTSGMNWLEHISDTEETERNTLTVRLQRFRFHIEYKGGDVDTWILTPISQ
jgi:hypothetical protein